MDNADVVYMSSQLSVMNNQIKIIRTLLDDMEMRMDEIQSEVDWHEGGVFSDFATNWFNDEWECDCSECRKDRSVADDYRMD